MMMMAHHRMYMMMNYKSIESNKQNTYIHIPSQFERRSFNPFSFLAVCYCCNIICFVLCACGFQTIICFSFLVFFLIRHNKKDNQKEKKRLSLLDAC